MHLEFDDLFLKIYYSPSVGKVLSECHCLPWQLEAPFYCNRAGAIKTEDARTTKMASEKMAMEKKQKMAKPNFWNVDVCKRRVEMLYSGCTNQIGCLMLEKYVSRKKRDCLRGSSGSLGNSYCKPSACQIMLHISRRIVLLFTRSRSISFYIFGPANHSSRTIPANFPEVATMIRPFARNLHWLEGHETRIKKGSKLFYIWALKGAALHMQIERFSPSHQMFCPN